MMKEVDVHFASGRDILSAYWGHLSGGGLAIERNDKTGELHEGQAVALRVHVAAQNDFAIRGKVVRTRPNKTVIAFDADDSQNRLLTAALADKTADKNIDIEARVRTTDAGGGNRAIVGRVFELSEEGCCIRLDVIDRLSLPVGAEVNLDLGELYITGGVVVSARGSERWLIFGPDSKANGSVHAYVQRLQ